MGSWKFDDPSEPTKITVTYKDPPPGWQNPQTFPLLKIVADTLILHSSTEPHTFVKEN